MATELRGDRLVALRELEGITQAELADTLGVTSAALTHVVKGDRPFPDSWAHAASEAYRLPIEFFAVVPTPADIGILTYKKKSTARVRDEKRVDRLYAEAGRLFRHASQASGYHRADLPDPADLADDPELVAEELRRRAGVGPLEPITNVTRFCERLGVGVIDNLDPRPQDEPRHSGASRPSRFEDRPLIALAADLSPALKRFVIAHELYHLVADRDLDRVLTSTRDPRELRANRFAGALLLPRAAALTRLTSTLTLHGYLRVKADFGVEVRGLIHRAKDLKVITPDRERSLYIQWSSSGWRTSEPVPVADERPLLLAQALRAAEGKNYAARLSHTIGVPAQLISHWTQGDRGARGEIETGARVFSLIDHRHT
jgi:Zn-dependent peptidase ImmA (M78 family)/DNA-binding XRE family transcriptional regulator